MKIKRFYMEDWLNNPNAIKYNLAESGVEDFTLKEFLKICNTDTNEFRNLFLGNSDTRGSIELRKEVSKLFKAVSISEVLITNGSSEAIFCFLNEILDKDDEVVIPFPTFQCLYQLPISIGCKVKFLDLLKCKDWRLDIKKLERLITKKTKLIIINSPHNPIGWTLNEKELEQIGKIAKKNDCYLFFDEHYRFLPLEEGTRLIPSGYDICKKIHKKTYASGSMGKCLGIVGTRIGYLVGEPELLAKCRDYKDYVTHTIPSVTDKIAYLALKNKNIIIKIKKEHILRNIQLLNRFMETNADFFDYVKPTGGVVCFPRLKYHMGDEKFCNDLFEKYGVYLLPGFGFEIKDHFRLNFGISSKKFEIALNKIQFHVNKLKDKIA